jgi:hypothetical protein
VLHPAQRRNAAAAAAAAAACCRGLQALYTSWLVLLPLNKRKAAAAAAAAAADTAAAAACCRWGLQALYTSWLVPNAVANPARAPETAAWLSQVRGQAHVTWISGTVKAQLQLPHGMPLTSPASLSLSITQTMQHNCLPVSMPFLGRLAWAWPGPGRGSARWVARSM